MSKQEVQDSLSAVCYSHLLAPSTISGACPSADSSLCAWLHTTLMGTHATQQMSSARCSTSPSMG